MRVLELAEPELGIGLGAVAGDDFGDAPVVSVGDQNAILPKPRFPKFRVFESMRHVSHSSAAASRCGGKYVAEPAFAGDLGDGGLEFGAGAAAPTAVEDVGDLGEFGLGQGLVQAAD